MASVSASATATASQIPSIPSTRGSVSTTATWNTSVRRNDIVADTIPLLSAVKNAEPKILKPLIRNETAYRRNPWQVMDARALSYPTKISARGAASSYAINISTTPQTPTIDRLIRSRFLSSP